MIDELQFGDFEEWVLLPVGESADRVTAHILERFASDPTPDALKQAIAGQLPLLAEQVVQGAGDDRTRVFAVWVLLPEGGKRLEIVSAAYGALASVPVGTTAPEFVETLLQGLELHQPVDLDEISTAIGPAHVVRARTFATTDHGLAISETVTVFWLPADDDVAIVLSSLPMEDLVIAADVASALRGLAVTASGSST